MEDEKKKGINKNEILKKHFDTYGKMLPDWQLRQQIIPMLDTAGLITQEKDPDDRRQKLISPTTQLTISGNSESGGGV